MAESEFQVESIGEVYAQALINEAQKQNALEQVSDDIQGIGELLANNKIFYNFTQALGTSEDEKAKHLDKIFSGKTISKGEGVLGRALASASPVIGSDLTGEPSIAARSAAKAGLKQAVVLPVISGIQLQALIAWYP